MFVTGSILVLLTKNVSKIVEQILPTQRPLQKPFSLSTRNSIKFADNVIRDYLCLLAKFQMVLLYISQENQW